MAGKMKTVHAKRTEESVLVVVVNPWVWPAVTAR